MSTVCGVPVTKQAGCPRAAFLITPPKLLRRLHLASTLPLDAIDRLSRCGEPTTAAPAQVVASLTQQDRAETETLSRSVLRVGLAHDPQRDSDSLRRSQQRLQVFPGHRLGIRGDLFRCPAR